MRGHRYRRNTPYTPTMPLVMLRWHTTWMQPATRLHHIYHLEPNIHTHTQTHRHTQTPYSVNYTHYSAFKGCVLFRVPGQPLYEMIVHPSASFHCYAAPWLAGCAEPWAFYFFWPFHHRIVAHWREWESVCGYWLGVALFRHWFVCYFSFIHLWLLFGYLLMDLVN